MRRIIVVICALYVWLPTRLTATAGPCRATPLTITVQVTSRVPETVIDAAFCEAGKVWHAAGLSLIRPAVDGTESLRVVIEERRSPESVEQLRLGWIVFKNDVPSNEIHLSYGNAQQLLERSYVALRSLELLRPWGPDTLVGRALGRALAHELGHYMLRSKAHTVAGLMKANHHAEEIFGANRGPFILDQALIDSCATRRAVD